MNRPENLRTWVEIDKKAIAENYRVFRGLLKKDCRFMAVVKSNAYGHDIIQYAKELDLLGVDWFGVDDINEGIELRKSGIKKPVLVLGFTPFEAFLVAANYDISITVSNYTTLLALENFKSKTPIKIHIKTDTGLHRQGFLKDDLSKLISTLKSKAKSSKLEVQGLYTHFAEAENPSSPHSLIQLREFNDWVEAFTKSGLHPIYHTAGTAATIALPESHFDMVRVGIGLYGLWPSLEIEKFAKRKIELKPVLSWRAIIGDVKSLKKGDKIGYDLTEEISRDSKIAVCGIGYWHGFPRSLSSKGFVGIKGNPVRVLGRVSMDMVVLDATDIDGVKTGDQVTIIGKDNDTEFTADALAQSAGTINYEIVTRLNPKILRFFI